MRLLPIRDVLWGFLISDHVRTFWNLEYDPLNPPVRPAEECAERCP